MRIISILALLAIPVAGHAATLGDASFENVQVSGYAYNPTGSTWTFADTSGISANGGPFYMGSAPDGTQAAFIQSDANHTGQISQVITGLVVGASYQFTYFDAARSATSANAIDVTFAGADLGTYTPGSTLFAQETTASFVALATSGTLTLTGMSSAADNSTAVDSVAIAAVPEPASLLLLGVGLLGVGITRRSLAAA